MNVRPDQPATSRPSLYAAVRLARLVQHVRGNLTARVKTSKSRVATCTVNHCHGFDFSPFSCVGRALASHWSPAKTKRNAEISRRRNAVQYKQLKFSTLLEDLDYHARGGDISLTAIASKDQLFLRHDVHFNSSISTFKGLSHVLDLTSLLLDRLQRLKDISVDQWEAATGLHYLKGVESEKLIANLEHLFLCLQHMAVEALIHHALSLLVADIYHWHQYWQQQKQANDGWFSEWPAGRRPLHTAWPWNIKPSLVVLWGVCWMFYDHNMSRGPSQQDERFLQQQPAQRPALQNLENHSIPAIRTAPDSSGVFMQQSPTQYSYHNGKMGLLPAEKGVQRRGACLGEHRLPQHQFRSPSNSPLHSSKDLEHRSFTAQQIPSSQRYSQYQDKQYSTGKPDLDNHSKYRSSHLQQQPHQMWPPMPTMRAESGSERTGSPVTSAALAHNPIPGRDNHGNERIFSTTLPPKSNVDRSVGNPYIISNSAFSSTIPSTTSTCVWPEIPGTTSWSQTYRSAYDDWQPTLSEPHVPAQSLLASDIIADTTPYVAAYPSTAISYQIPSAWALPQDFPSDNGLALGLVLPMQDPQNYPSPHSEGSGRASSLCPTFVSTNKPSPDRLPDVSPDSLENPDSRRSSTQSRGPGRNEEGQIYCSHPACATQPPVFARKCEWTKHMDKHTRPYKCNETGCEKIEGFTYSGGLLRHQREVHKQHGGPKAPRMCPYRDCKRSTVGFSRKENLHEHLRRVHRGAGALAEDLPFHRSLSPLAAPAPPQGLTTQPLTESRKRRRVPLDDTPVVTSENGLDGTGDLHEQVKRLKRESEKKDERLRKLEILVRHVIQGQHLEVNSLENV